METAADTSGGNSYAALLVGLLLAALSYGFLVYRRSSRCRYRRHNLFDCPLPPSPTGVPLLGNLPFLQPKLHSYFAAVAATHGPIFRLRLGRKTIVVISSRDLTREVLRDQDAVFANRDMSVAARVITYGGLDVAFCPYGTEWRMRRRVCVQELLAGPRLDAFYGLRRQGVRAMLARVAALAAAGEAVNIGREMFATAMNVMANVLWGSSRVERAVTDELKDVMMEMTLLLGLPNVSDFYPWLERFDLQGIEKKMLTLRERYDSLFERIIADREENGKCGSIGSGGDFLDVMLGTVAEGARHGKASFTRTHVKAILMDMVSGGTDTTSNTIEFVLAEMLNRPETIRAAQEELDKAVGCDCMVEESEAVKLRYLSAAIKEGMRLHPVLPLLIPHCPSEDCVVGGYTVPAGSRVFINAWAIHRDPEAWKDPLEYKPERFFDGADAASCWLDASGNDLSYIPFGSGRRMCLGMAMAERMLAYVLAMLLHSFDWQLPDGESRVDLEEKFGITVKKKKPLLLIPKPRLSNPDLYRQ